MRTKTVLLASVLVSATALSPLSAHAQSQAEDDTAYDPSIAYAEAMPATADPGAIVVVATGIPIDRASCSASGACARSAPSARLPPPSA